MPYAKLRGSHTGPIILLSLSISSPNCCICFTLKTAKMADADLSMRDDLEKSAGRHGDKSSSDSSPIRYDKEAQIRRGSITPHHEGFFSAFTLESFKRNPNARVVTEATDNEGRPLPDQPPAEPALAMKLKPRHLQMIAIGGSIGKILTPEPQRMLLLRWDCRYWSLRWFRICARPGRPGISCSSLWIDRYYAVLHRSRSGRACSSVPHCRCFLRLL